MRNIIKYQNTSPVRIVEKQGIAYKVVDMGGYTVELRVKPQAEIQRDSLLFRSK